MCIQYGVQDDSHYTMTQARLSEGALTCCGGAVKRIADLPNPQSVVNYMIKLLSVAARAVSAVRTTITMHAWRVVNVRSST